MNNDELKAAAFRRAEYLRWLADGIGDDGAFDWYEGVVAELDKQILSAWAIDRLTADEAERAEREKPIDEEWLRSLANECEQEADGEIAAWFDTSLNQISLSKPLSSDSWNVSVMDTTDGDESASLPSIATRGQLLDLLRALGVEAK
jgi:hypothetical protein